MCAWGYAYTHAHSCRFSHTHTYLYYSVQHNDFHCFEGSSDGKLSLNLGSCISLSWICRSTRFLIRIITFCIGLSLLVFINYEKHLLIIKSMNSIMFYYFEREIEVSTEQTTRSEWIGLTSAVDHYSVNTTARVDLCGT